MERIATPIEKIYEAWSAVADGRVTIAEGSTIEAGRAIVISSDKAKTYTVTWRDSGSVFTSSDSATLWRGYPGYPVIAVLMKQGRLPYEETVAERFADVNWTARNKEHKRDYAAAVLAVEEARGIDRGEASAAAETAYRALQQLNITIRRK